ncbi:hypothetical protein M2283_010290 [Streptomyces pseudovenezuelae]|uniref:Uncharacterized protein n=1 Tax=Streptomyces pseudovenezuelae TaxID=67350 RepID=A0ABT6M314_9ACTN|nr:hypothetical protein [Streptomyces pseudovenezuelae]
MRRRPLRLRHRRQPDRPPRRRLRRTPTCRPATMTSTSSSTDSRPARPASSTPCGAQRWAWAPRRYAPRSPRPPSRSPRRPPRTDRDLAGRRTRRTVRRGRGVRRRLDDGGPHTADRDAVTPQLRSSTDPDRPPANSLEVVGGSHAPEAQTPPIPRRDGRAPHRPGPATSTSTSSNAGREGGAGGSTRGAAGQGENNAGAAIWATVDGNAARVAVALTVPLTVARALSALARRPGSGRRGRGAPETTSAAAVEARAGAVLDFSAALPRHRLAAPPGYG